ncbi:unnamed protein product, partial [Staurois parvus]
RHFRSTQSWERCRCRALSSHPRKQIRRVVEALRMPRLKATRVKRKKTKVPPQRLAAKRKKTHLQPPTDFEEVAVYFSEEEWRYLKVDQMELYRQVMIDNYQAIHSLGFHQLEKPTLISKIEQDEDLFITELKKHSQDAPSFNTEVLHVSQLTSKERTVEDIYLTGNRKNRIKPSSNENGSLPPRHKYNFRDRAAVAYTMFYDDEAEVREHKPHQSLQRKSVYDKIIGAPRFKTKGVNTSLFTPKKLKVEVVHFTGDLKNSIKTSSNENGSLPTKHQHKSRVKAAVQCTSYEGKMSELKPRKSLKRKSSYDKIVGVPRLNTEELHTSFLKSEILTEEKVHLTGDLEKATKTSSNKNGSLPPKRQHKFRDKSAVQCTLSFEDKVRERKPRKSLRRKSSLDKIIDVPNTEELHTSFLKHEILTEKKYTSQGI